MTPITTINLFVCLFLVGCSMNSNEKPALTVYVSADEQIAREVFAVFTEKTGIEIEWVGDTES